MPHHENWAAPQAGSPIHATVTIPGSKSLTNRTLVLSAVAAAQGPAMGRAILNLYRSAAQPAVADMGSGLPKATARPGLSVLPTEDHFVGTPGMRRRAADRAGARTEVLDGLGHWWMLQDPRRGAEMLTRFWGSLS